MSLIEGMAHGRTMSATAPTGDVPALAAALHGLIDDPALRARFGAAAQRSHRELFDLDSYVGRLAAIWRSAQMPVG